MKNSENLRLIVKLRRNYRTACNFCLFVVWRFPTIPRANKAAIPVATNSKEVVTNATIQNTMSSSVLFAGLAGLCTILAAVFGGFAWYISWQEGNAKDAEAQRLAETNKANFLVLEKDASDAKSAQQKVEIELNKTGVLLAKAQRELAPRRLSSSEIQQLAELLKPLPKPGPVWLFEHNGADKEAWDFTNDLRRAFKIAGFQMGSASDEVMREEWITSDMQRMSGTDLSKYFNRTGIVYKSSWKANSLDFVKRPGVTYNGPTWVLNFAEELQSLGYKIENGNVSPKCPDDGIVIIVNEKPRFAE